jgi:hypothetical protein
MSQPINLLKVEYALEMVCQLGCATVEEIMKEIERGILPDPAKNLNAKECEYLLFELKTIMQTYK